MPFDLSVLAALETLSRTNDIPGTAVSVLLVLFLIRRVRHPTVRAHADYRFRLGTYASLYIF
jgi:hypothetical protein